MFKYPITFILLWAIPIFCRANIVVLNGLTHTYKTEKEKLYSGKIEMQNTGPLPRTVKLFLQDLSYSHDGTILYTDPHTNSRTNADWIELSTDLVNLAPGQKVEVIYQVSVPDTVRQVGSYWSTIIVEPQEDINPQNEREGVQITSVVRYAVQVITDYVMGPLSAELKFEKIGVERTGQTKILNVALSNKSHIYCRASAMIELYDLQGNMVGGQLQSPAMGLLPGNSKTFSIDIGKIPPGTYRGVVFAADQEENTFAMNIDLEI